jgi:c-di-GMP-related signal transduction protein
MPEVNVVVGRQAIFDADLDVIGYELLFRPLAATEQAASMGHLMTAEVLFGAVNLGIDKVVGDKLAFCNAERRVLVGDVPIVLPPERTVIEVVGSVQPDEEVLAGCRQLVEQGYRIAVDDFCGQPGEEPLLELAWMAKIDLEQVSLAALAGLMAQCQQSGVVALAEKVETLAQLEAASSLGFQYFQGYLLSRPVAISGRAPGTTDRARVELATTLLKEEFDLDALESVLRSDPALVHQLLRLAGIGAARGLRRQVRTLREALVILGMQRLQGWAALLLLVSKRRGGEERMATALIRARMCELLAMQLDPQNASMAFVAGVISAFDLMLEQPLEEVLESLPLDPELREAAAGRNGPVGSLVGDVIDYQLGVHAWPRRSAVNDDMLHRAFVEAVVWTNEVMEGIFTRA